MQHYTSGSLQARMDTDPEFRAAESTVRELEKEFNNIARPEVEELKRKLALLKDSDSEAELVKRARDKLDKAQKSLEELSERLRSAWECRDELLGKKPTTSEGRSRERNS